MARLTDLLIMTIADNWDVKPQTKQNVLAWFCLFDLILYVPVNNFSVMLGWVFLGFNQY